MWPVSRRINKTGAGDDDPTLIDEVQIYLDRGVSATRMPSSRL
jgi:hypothetical protein